VLSPVAAGMVALVDAGGGATQLMEVAAVTDSAHATFSALRGRSDQAAAPGLVSGSVSVTVLSFHPQIAAVSDRLLEAADVAAEATVEHPRYFRTACVLGTLSAVFRVLAEGGTAAQAAKRDFYEQMFTQIRRGMSGRVDRRPVSAGVGTLTRE